MKSLHLGLEARQLLFLRKGAEAVLYVEEWQGRKAIMKRRLPKAYRLSALDKAIRDYRTIHEPQFIHKAKEAGVSTPTIYFVDLANANIIMEFIEGTQVKQVLHDMSQKERRDLCHYIGKLIGNLHNYGIIHGDLTTSNMIVTQSGKVFYVCNFI